MASEKKQKFSYGGQAIIEGVMMRGPKDFSIAVRRADGEIVTTTEDVESILGKFKWLNKPFLRGTLALIDSMALGIKALKYSADIAMTDAERAEAAKKAEKKAATADQVVIKADAVGSEPEKKPSKVNDMTIGVMMVVGLILGFGLFFFVPIVIAKLIPGGISTYTRAIFEGLIKISMFIAYVVGISFLPDIRRVFQYHGAEHKVINAYEAGAELTVDNVKGHTKVHVRCGTSFILVVLVTSIVVFMFVPVWNPLLRWAYKMALLPLVAGIAYEVIRFAGAHKDSLFTKMLVAPGLLMQKITTREPEPEMIEVAIKSLQGVLEEEASHEGDAKTSAV